MSNKYVLTPSLDEVEIDLLQGLKDFRHRVRKCAAAIKLREGTVKKPARPPLGPRRADATLANNSDIDSWHEAEEPEIDDEDRYGLGSDLYDTISSTPEADSGAKRLEYFFDKLELEFVTSIKALARRTQDQSPSETKF